MSTFADDLETVEVLIRFSRTRIEELDGALRVGPDSETRAKRRAWRKRLKSLENQHQAMCRREANPYMKKA